MASQSRMTAASIISRSASGSATLPNADSTRQRRASQPSTWSVTPRRAKTTAPPRCTPVRRERARRRRESGAAEQGSARSGAAQEGGRRGRGRGARIEPAPRQGAICSIRCARIRRWRSGRWSGGPSRGRSAWRGGSDAPGLRQRTVTRSSERFAAERGRRLLGLARGHAGRGGPPRRPTECPSTRRLPRDARRGLHRRRRVPLPRARRGARAREAAEAGVGLRAPLRRLRARRHRRFRQSSLADYLAQVERLRAAGIRVGVAPHSVRACPAGLARGDRPLCRA